MDEALTVKKGTWIRTLLSIHDANVELKPSSDYYANDYYRIVEDIKIEEDGCWIRPGVYKVFVPDGAYAILWDWK